MTADDIDAATTSILADDWGDRRSWFEFVVANPACRAIVAESRDERVIGTGVLTVNGSVGWIGTIWVASSERRRGVGLALTEATLQAGDDNGCRTFLLVATRAGQPMYERLGFEVQTWYRTMEARPGSVRRLAGPSDATIRAFRTEDLPEMAGLDRAATGEDRAVSLALLSSAAGTRVLEREGRVAGFVARAPWGGGATIAPRMDDALAILDARIATAPDRRVRCGVLLENADGARALEAAGWVEAWRAPRLVRGVALDWHPDHIWGQFNHAMG